MKKNNAGINMLVMNTVKMHPISAALAFLHIALFVVQGNTGVFIAGLFASLAAYAAEMLFHATGAIKVRRGHVRKSSAGTALNQIRHTEELRFCRNPGVKITKNSEAHTCRMNITRIRQKNAA